MMYWQEEPVFQTARVLYELRVSTGIYFDVYNSQCFADYLSYPIPSRTKFLRNRPIGFA